MSDDSVQLRRRDYLAILTISAIALLAVLLTLDAAGDYPKLFEGPGITLDESFNVQMGVYQWNALREYNIAVLHPDSVREVFGPGSNYNPDHPPLGRLWLGFWHDLTKWLFPPADHPSPFVTDCARVGSATAFAITVFLIGVFATKWYGRAAGIVAAVSFVLMPRVFAHAHLASLETSMNLTYSATMLAVAHWWLAGGQASGGRESSEGGSMPRQNETKTLGGVTPPARLVCIGTGVLFGLALLTKMQAILIPPVVGLWALWHWRTRAIKPLAIFGLVGLVVFFIGWPWLWLDPAKHLREYFARTTSRAVLNCYYLGRVWADKDVPWHYPFVMFAVTVPVGLHALGMLGAVGHVTRSVSEDAGDIRPRIRFGLLGSPREQLLVMATLFPLVLFALPSIAVYDGERLFLVSYPIWAVLIGRGVASALGQLQRHTGSGQWRLFGSHRARITAVTLFLMTQSVGVIVMHPCQLSYYNLLVGGLSGADHLGFERTYWGDSVTRSFLQSLVDGPSRGATVRVEPVLHQFQLPELLSQSPILRNQDVKLIETYEMFSDKDAGKPRKFLGFLRRADLPVAYVRYPDGCRKSWLGDADKLDDPEVRTVSVKRQGVLLAIGMSLVAESADAVTKPQ